MRGSIAYHALRRWRTTIKDSQLAALKAIKRDPSPYFIESVAKEMVTAACALFGRETFRAIVPVPCGNSGPNCLTARLSKSIAALLSIRHIEAFEPLPYSGGSHPKSNVRRKPMRLVEPVECPVLLIDDVATSGAHLGEAVTLLRNAGTPSVLPMVWLAAG
jgi:predicted amidophosphoribosyltransferase